MPSARALPPLMCGSTVPGVPTSTSTCPPSIAVAARLPELKTTTFTAFGSTPAARAIIPITTWFWLPSAAAKPKLTEAGSFFMRAMMSCAEASGESAFVETTMYSRIRMLSGVKSR
jgi:hypothetical protein